MDREDLGFQFGRILRHLIEAERPLLAAHDLSMWGYIALTHLAASPVDTQLELARAIGYDKTRLVALLDELQAAGLVRREPDPDDRRARTVHLTNAGRRRHADAQRDIREMEEAMLTDLSSRERSALLAALGRLAGPPA